MNNKPKCENCLYFYRTTTIESYDGECQLNPPVATFIGNKIPIWQGSIVDPDSLCRHHKFGTHEGLRKCTTCYWKDTYTNECKIEPPLPITTEENETYFPLPVPMHHYGCSKHTNMEDRKHEHV